MQDISYRVIYSPKGWLNGHRASYGSAEEIIRVPARSINSGYPKALKRALEPLGDGTKREIVSIEFWEVH